MKRSPVKRKQKANPNDPALPDQFPGRHRLDLHEAFKHWGVAIYMSPETMERLNRELRRFTPSLELTESGAFRQVLAEQSTHPGLSIGELRIFLRAKREGKKG